MKKLLLIALSSYLLAISFPANAQYTDLVNFTGTSGSYPGQYPQGSLTPSVTGDTLYGMTYYGGTNNYGCIFSVYKDGTNYTDLINFTGTTGSYLGKYSPRTGSLTLSGRVLYGMTEEGGTNGYGNIFSVHTDGTNFTNIVSFTGTSGAYPGEFPENSLTLSGGVLYGTTYAGGAYSDGIIFSVHTDGTNYTDLINFEGVSGSYPGAEPWGSLTLSGGMLYGMTYEGGANGAGCIFSVHADGSSYTDLVDFTGYSGSYPGEYPEGSLTLFGGVLYGMTLEGGIHGNGNIFSVHTDGSNYKNLVSFTGTSGSYLGQDPFGSLTLSGGVLYGMTSNGGVNNDGTIFSVDTNGSSYTDLVNFTGTTGSYPGTNPEGSLTLLAGVFYGMAYGGGANSDGVVFSFIPPLHVTASVIANVTCNNGNNGIATANPSGGTSPYTYSWAPSGGANSTASNLSTGTYTVTVTDNNSSTATASVTITEPNPLRDSVVVASTINVLCHGSNTGSAVVGVKYGTSPYTYSWSSGAGINATASGLSAGVYTVVVTDSCGTTVLAAVIITQPTAYTALINFTGQTGSYPGEEALGSLTPSVTGDTLYGMTYEGGANSIGNIFSVHKDGTDYTDMVDFTGTSGSYPSRLPAGSLTLSASGKVLYGMTYYGGTNSDGVIFSINTDGTKYANIVNFSGGTGSYPGAYPYGSLTLLGGVLYGMTESGGIPSEGGVVFSVDTNGTNYSDLVNFTGTSGSYPGDDAMGSLTPSVTGDTLYGMTNSGGANSDGNIFSVHKDGTNYTNLLNFTGSTGSYPGSYPYGSLTLSGGVLYGMAYYGAANNDGCIFSVKTNGSNYTVLVNFTGTSGSYPGKYPEGSLTLSGGLFYGMTYQGGTNSDGNIFSYNINSTVYTNLINFTGSSGSYLGKNPPGVLTLSGGVLYGMTQNGGTNSDGVVFSYMPPLGATASITTNVSCYGNNNGNAMVSAIGGTSPYIYSWSNGITTNPTGAVLSAGSYTVTVQDGCGASATASVTITQSTALSASASVTANISCNGGSNGSVLASASGGVTPYTYLWSAGAPATIEGKAPYFNTASGNGSLAPTEVPEGPSRTNLGADCYTVTVTDNNGCSATASVCLTQPYPLDDSIVAASTVNVTCSGTNGSATVGVKYGTSPYTYSWSSGANDSTASGLSAGSYMVTVQDSCGASATALVTISQVASSLSASASVTANISCNGGSNGSVLASASGGVTPYTYLWSAGAPATTEGKAPYFNTASGNGSLAPTEVPEGPSRTNLGADCYTVTVTDNNGCSATASVCLTQPYPLDDSIIAVSTVNVTCSGTNGSATVGVKYGTSPYTYSWSSGANDSTASGLSAGSYMVTIQDSCGASATALVTISQVASSLSASASVTTPIVCNGASTGAVSVTPSGGTSPYTYELTQTFSYTGGVQTFTVPAGVTQITTTVTGGAGGGGYSGGYFISGGNGATFTGVASATAGHVLGIVAGGEGQSGFDNGVGGGGGGGSYVWDESNTTLPIAIAAGGGGDGFANGPGGVGGNNLSTNITTTSTGSRGGSQAAGGTGGNGGAGGAGDYPGAGGAGWLSNGGTINSLPYYIAYGGSDMLNGFAGGGGTDANDGAGGFGGGGGAGYDGGGGGGGYNGGGGGNDPGEDSSPGSGGGSYFNTAYGTLPANVIDTCTSNGLVTISYQTTSVNQTQLGAGTYTVTVMDNNGCSTTASVSLSQPATLSASASVTANVTCNSAQNGSASVSVSGGTSPYDYTWNGGAFFGGSTGTVTGLSAGAYTITVTDNCTASATTSVSITQPPALSATASATANAACNSSIGSASVSISGGTSPYEYSWSGGAGNNDTATGLSTGSYTVTVADNCSALTTASVIISEPTALSVSASVATNVTCNSGTDGSASVSVSGSASPYDYTWNGGAFFGGSTATLTGLSAGAYTITVADNCTASGTASVSISQPTALSTTASVIANVSCNGGNTGSALANVSGESSPYTYSWFNGGTNNNPPILSTSNPTGAVLGTGTYTVIVRDICGAAVSASVTITQPNGLLVSASVTANVTSDGGNNGSASAILSGGTSPYTYSWSGGAGFNSTVNGLSAGAYTVTVQDSCGGAATASVTITQPTNILSASASVTANVQCNGQLTGSALATVSNGISPYTYSWSGGAGNDSIASGLSAGNYTVTVEDNTELSATASVSISQPTALSIDDTIIASSGCGKTLGNALVTPTGGNSPYTYSWSNGVTNSSTGATLSTGTYTITVQDHCGASVTASVSIQPLRLEGLVGNPITCNGASNGLAKVAGVSGGVAPYTYSWSNGSAIYIASNLSPGAYSVTVTDKNGCSSTSSITLTQPALLRDSVASISYPLCSGQTGGATIGVKGGTTPYRYLWAPNTSDNTAIASGVIVQRTYSLQVKDQNGCFNNLTFSISQPPVLHDSIVSGYTVNTTCGQSNGSATVGVKYGISPYTYSWSGGAGNNATASGLSSGTYTVTVNDAGSCSASTSVSIAKSAAIAMTPVVSNPISCNGASNGLAKVATITGGAAPYTYSWSNGSAIYIASNLSVGTYSVTVTDRTGCISIAAVTVTQPATLRDSVASLVSPPCSGEGKGIGSVVITSSVTIGVSGGTSPYRYTWAPNISTTDSAEGLTVRSYTVLVRDNNSCSSYVYFSVSCSDAAEASHNTTSCCPGMDNINLYPNPNTGQFTLSGLQKDMILEVYDYTGKKISTIAATGETMQLNIFNQANGVYLVRILDKNGNLISQKKVVKTQ